ncbi:hypothetical protein AMQ84_00980 [Paenibacillus riograndensis]|uniref:Uncharacterized protein n=1 Tax=Paenibacillus riograndensis TaxID=483937 RepID=A0A132UC24_9BACL|nr:hypothetical protein [Paenibacillus riograndensis]KWX81130.1 hypothetical protein AMQ84_00980 [Paenibacillus riograndensis]
MRVFGDSRIFSIEYDFTKNPFNEKGLLAETWGKFELWVNGKELCKFFRHNYEKTYEWNLIHVVEWLGENLPIILTNEEFPLPVHGKTALELLASSLNFDSDNDDEFDAWFSTKQDWEFKHSWFSNRGGSYLPEVYFRRVGQQIEISWDNENLYSEEISFTYRTGLEYVPIHIFDSVLKDYIYDFLETLGLKTECYDEYVKFIAKVSKNE